MDKLIFDRFTIHSSIELLAQNLNQDYMGRHVIFVGVLKGCFMFLAHLLPYIKFTYTVEFLTAKSYVHNKQSDNLEIKQELNPKTIFANNVIIVDDIYDSGKTVDSIKEYLEAMMPRSIKSCVLVQRTGEKKADYAVLKLDSKEFIYGFGMDNLERSRGELNIYAITKKD